MKKIFFVTLLTALLGVSLSSCKSNNLDKSQSNVLKIYNWQDYIFEGDDETDSVIDQFIAYYKETYNETIKVEYYTFETNETMLNVLKTGKSHYDLICPSDYTIQKMIKEGLVDPLNMDLLPNYTKYASPYIKDLFDNSKTINELQQEVSWSDYSIPYMWGTMGFMYDPEKVENEEDINTWNVVWNKDYKGLSTLKDSVRDTYCAAVFYVYQEELNEYLQQYEDKILSSSELTQKITEVMNRKDKKTIELVEKALKEAKDNIYGFEVDSGKSDIVTGKIAINFCWSGDAVYSMDCAEEESDKYLNYVVPKEGSNVWFDGWVMPKNANQKLAHEFLNFICDPKIARDNMNEIGYTSAIAGDEVLEMVKEWYEPEGLTEEGIQQGLADGTLFEWDLTYFFGTEVSDSPIIYTEEINRQLSAQYPDYETIIKCAIMEDFGKENEKILEMWARAKSDLVPIWAWIFIAIAVIFVTTTITVNAIHKTARNKRIQQKKQAANQKNG